MLKKNMNVVNIVLIINGLLMTIDAFVGLFRMMLFGSIDATTLDILIRNTMIISLTPFVVTLAIIYLEKRWFEEDAES